VLEAPLSERSEEGLQLLERLILLVRPLELVGLFQQLEEGQAFLHKLADEVTRAAIMPVSFITSFFPVG
jgi:hypothetical protein